MAAKSRTPILVLAALAAAALAFAAPARADLTQPVPLDPGNGASVEALPPFSWSPVAGADSYQFQVAADQNFNSPVGRQGEGQLHDEEHARDPEEDPAERPLLVACPSDDPHRRRLALVEPALDRQVLDAGAVLA